MSRQLPALVAPLLCFLCACPAGGGGGGGGPVTEVPIGGCETDPFAGTCVAEFARGDGCWDPEGSCHGSLFSDVYWDSGASIHASIAPDFSSVELEAYGSMDRCFTGSSPLNLGSPNLPVTALYTRDSDGVQLRYRIDAESIVYTCADGSRVRALLEQQECVYGGDNQQCALEDLEDLDDLDGAPEP